jgi:hypothetical protein
MISNNNSLDVLQLIESVTKLVDMLEINFTLSYDNNKNAELLIIDDLLQQVIPLSKEKNSIGVSALEKLHKNLEEIRHSLKVLKDNSNG